jgi:DNA-binding MarR family transcriptional regulator
MVDDTGCCGFGALVDRVGRATRAIQFSCGLSPAQWEALRYVAQANRYSRNPSALANFLGATKGTISQTLIALEEKGHLRRVRGAPDRRAVRLDLTASGEALLARDPLLCLERAAEALPAEQRTALTGGLNQLLRDLQLRCGSSSFGVCEQCHLFGAESAVDEMSGPHRCGLTGEPIREIESQQICISFQLEA